MIDVGLDFLKSPCGLKYSTLKFMWSTCGKSNVGRI